MFGLPASLPWASASLFFLAQGEAPAANGPAPSAFYQFLPYLAVIPIFYLLMIRPQMKQDKQRRESIDRLKKNDKVVTSSGIYGTVVSVDPEADKITLRLDDDGKVKVTFTRGSIARVVGDPPLAKKA